MDREQQAAWCRAVIETETAREQLSNLRLQLDVCAEDTDKAQLEEEVENADNAVKVAEAKEQQFEVELVSAAFLQQVSNVQQQTNLSTSTDTAQPIAELPPKIKLQPIVEGGKIRMITPPKPQKFKSGENFSRFVHRFKHNILLGRYNDPNLDVYFLELIEDPTAYDKLSKIKLTPQQKGDVNLLTEIYENAMFPESETRTLRTEMLTLKQKPEESVEKFTFRINELASKAYKNRELENEGSLSTLLNGVRDPTLKQKLWEAELSTFDEAVKLATKLEKIAATVATTLQNDLTLTADNTPIFAVDNTEQRQTRSFHAQENQRPLLRRRPVIYCWACGAPGHKSFECEQSSNRQQDQYSYRVRDRWSYIRGSYNRWSPREGNGYNREYNGGFRRDREADREHLNGDAAGPEQREQSSRRS